MKKSQKKLLLGLAAPFFMSVMNLSMFRVALPAIRGTFNLPADSTAWLVTAYSLAFMVFMPLYGWLGDRLSKRWIFIAGIGIYSLGTMFILLSSTMGFILVGRVIQAIGVSGISPLCIAAITNQFSPEERGAALGKWNSAGAFAAMLGPFIAGLLIDHYQWRMIYLPILLIGTAAIFIVWKRFPSAEPDIHSTGNRRLILKNFDWIGVLLFGFFLTLFVFYLSSRPITGKDPLTDWRLGIGAAITLVLLVIWEKRYINPILPVDLLRFEDFIPATLCSATRMFIMGGVNLLVPLFMSEIYGLSAAWIGSMLAATFISHFFSMRIGGKLADRWGSRWIVVAGLLIQGAAIISLALIDDSASPLYFAPILMIHSLGAGAYLAPLHRAAMSRIPRDRSGAGAGFYSSIRFGGALLGPTIAGVFLENGFLKLADPFQAYQRTFWVILAAVVVGILIASRIKD
jgi:EmrB/QacA subfamily drug resistance transporter